MNEEKNDKLIDYNIYGIYDGEILVPAYNRQERRKYIKEHKRDKNATYCIYCNAKTLSITDDNCKLCCELCGKIKESQEP